MEVIFAEFCVQSLNLVFVPFCEVLVGERTPKGIYVYFDGIASPSFLVSQIVHSFVEVTCGADV